MNSVSVVGNLATEVDLRDLGDERKVASFLLAIDRVGKDDEADFVRVSAWNRQAELCVQYLAKGQKVGVEGRLRSSSWTGEDGKRRSSVEVLAGRVEFLYAPGRKAAGEAPFEEAAAA
ncbi:MAG: single-stranded DNA-binding protein [Gaiellaceae bacterium]